ncbi:MAG: hypothetical protein RR569_08250 [Acinetobacter sp.]
MSWQIYTQYDEDSLTMHSNAGLLRRARKALAEVQLLSEHDATELLFKVEECEVKLPSEGMTKASCNCSAQGSCKHILSSILWIQENAALFVESANVESISQTENIEHAIHLESDHQNFEKPEQPQHSIENTKTALALILEFDITKIQKQAGKANVRLAYEFVQNWLANEELCIFDIQAEKISFQTDLSPNKVLLYPATGFDGMLSEIADKQKIAGHLACITYLWFKNSPEQWQWSIDTAQQEQNIGHQLSTDDLEFIDELKNICESFIQQGLSHLAKESVMALHIYNMQARAQSLPRLGSVLRALHGTMKQFLENNVQIEEQHIFNQIAYLYAYLAALSEAQKLAPEIQSKALIQLRGSIQRDYQQETVEHLIPLGCEWWNTDSGARGLTICFWDVKQKQLKEVTQARANHLDRTFDMQSAAATGIWGSSLSYLLQHQLELIDAKVSSETSFSASSDTRFLQKGLISDLKKADLDQLNIGVSKWHDLQTLITPHSSLEPPQSRYVLLRHKSITAPDLNEFEQSFEYRVVDDQNNALKLSIPIEPEYRVRIKHLTQLIQNDKIIASLVRINTTTQQIQLIPCSIFLETAKGLKIFSLDYDYPVQKKSTLAELITGRFEKLLAEKKQWQNHQNYSAIDLLVLEIQALLEFYANTGRAVLDLDDLNRIQDIAQQFSNLGLDFIEKSLKLNLSKNNLATHLLKWRHVLLQLQQLNRRIILEGQIVS